MALGDQLQIPDVAKHDSKSFELLRVWVANTGQHVSLRAGVWDDPAAWGLMLADLAKHVANSFEETAGISRMDALKRITVALTAELASPTDEPSGRCM